MLMLLIKSDPRGPAQRPGGTADLPRRLRVPVRVPDLDHLLRHRPPAGVQSPAHVEARARDRLPARAARAGTVTVDVGGVPVGSAHPIVVQSMTNTDTADANATAIQVAQLAHAGSELVRVTVNTEAAAAAVPEIVAQAPRTSASACRSSATSTTTGTLLRRATRRAAAPRQVPHQPGQRRRQAPRRKLPDDRPGRDRATTGRSGSASTGARSTSSC